VSAYPVGEIDPDKLELECLLSARNTNRMIYAIPSALATTNELQSAHTSNDPRRTHIRALLKIILVLRILILFRKRFQAPRNIFVDGGLLDACMWILAFVGSVRFLHSLVSDRNPQESQTYISLLSKHLRKLIAAAPPPLYQIGLLNKILIRLEHGPLFDSTYQLIQRIRCFTGRRSSPSLVLSS
jgi:hypothetical protein